MFKYHSVLALAFGNARVRYSVPPPGHLQCAQLNNCSLDVLLNHLMPGMHRIGVRGSVVMLQSSNMCTSLSFEHPGCLLHLCGS